VTGLDFSTIDRLTGGRIGTFDAPCPLCGPYKSPHGQRRKVMRVWRVEPGFATYHCERCGESGYARDRHAPEPDPVRLAKARAEAAERDCAHKADRIGLARWLWSRRKPIAGTIAERYLRDARGIARPLPATLGFLPASGKYPPAMVAAFGLAHETEPGVIAIDNDAIRGIHVTRLLPDGSDRERGDKAKIMIGHSIGAPINLAAAPDGLALAITEGIEDALTMHEATGLGAWAAGSASRLPALADAIPDFIECVTVVVDDDADGRRHAATLADRIRARRIEVRQVTPNRWRESASQSVTASRPMAARDEMARRLPSHRA
jgi:Toprim domain